MAKFHLKLFKKDDNVSIFPISPNNYYDDIKRYRNDKYRQVILTSDSMIRLIRNVFLKQKASIKKVELMDIDDAYQNDLDELVGLTQSDRGNGVNLFEELDDLYADDSIEIRLVKFSVNSGKDNEKILFSFYNNGKVTVTTEKLSNSDVQNLVENIVSAASMVQ